MKKLKKRIIPILMLTIFCVGLTSVQAATNLIFGPMDVKASGGRVSTASVTATNGYHCAYVTTLGITGGDNVDVILQRKIPSTNNYENLGKATVHVGGATASVTSFQPNSSVAVCNTKTTSQGRTVTHRVTCPSTGGRLNECILKNDIIRVQIYNGSVLGGTANLGGYIEFVD